MVDFAHTKELADTEKDLDEDYLYGLRTLIRFVESVSNYRCARSFLILFYRSFSKANNTKKALPTHSKKLPSRSSLTASTARNSFGV